MPDYRPNETWKKSRCKRKSEKEDEMDTSKIKAVSNFELQSSLMFDGKGRKNSNISKPIHSVCKNAITTQERTKASREWNEETRELYESNV